MVDVGVVVELEVLLLGELHPLLAQALVGEGEFAGLAVVVEVVGQPLAQHVDGLQAEQDVQAAVFFDLLLLGC